MVKKGVISCFILAFLQTPIPVVAHSVMNISTSHAEGRSTSIPFLSIWSGMGLSLNFTDTGEKIVRAWLDDPSRLTLDFDTPLCTGQDNERCGAATIIHLRRIHPLQFPHLPRTATTLLTVVTEGGSDRKVYYFRLGYGKGQPEYVAVNINPDPRPALQARQQQEEANRNKADRIAEGLAIARQKDAEGKNQQVFNKVEILLAHVRGGMSFADALRRTNLAPSVLEELEALTTASGGQS
jgi:hypothetical protein